MTRAPDADDRAAPRRRRWTAESSRRSSRCPTSGSWRDRAVEPAPGTTSTAAPGTRSASPRTRPRGCATGSGRASSSTSPRSTRRRRSSGRPAACRSRSPRWPPTASPIPDGEVATARAAAAAGIPFIPSTMSSRRWRRSPRPRPAGRAGSSSTPRRPGRTRSLVERAEAAGYGAIVVTVDLPELGYRDRDRRNGFALDVPLGNFEGDGPGPTHAGHGDASGYEIVDEWIAKHLTWDARDDPLVVEPAARPEGHHDRRGRPPRRGARRRRDRRLEPWRPPARPRAGADRRPRGGRRGAPHGGLGRRRRPARPRRRDRCALGARGVLVGRPILWALAAGGQAGVERALAILREEFELASRCSARRRRPT